MALWNKVSCHILEGMDKFKGVQRNLWRNLVGCTLLFSVVLLVFIFPCVAILHILLFIFNFSLACFEDFLFFTALTSARSYT
jgi:hypothetical protein